MKLKVSLVALMLAIAGCGDSGGSSNSAPSTATTTVGTTSSPTPVGPAGPAGPAGTAPCGPSATIPQVSAETWVLIPEAGVVEAALTKHGFVQCRDTFLADVAHEVTATFARANAQLNFTTDTSRTLVGYPGFFPRSLPVFTKNSVALFGGQQNGIFGLTIVDKAGNKNFVFSTGKAFGQKFGIDLEEISDLYVGGTYSGLVAAVASVLSHQVGHNVGLSHSPSGIMISRPDINSPEVDFGVFVPSALPIPGVCILR